MKTTNIPWHYISVAAYGLLDEGCHASNFRCWIQQRLREGITHFVISTPQGPEQQADLSYGVADIKTTLLQLGAKKVLTEHQLWETRWERRMRRQQRPLVQLGLVLDEVLTKSG